MAKRKYFLTVRYKTKEDFDKHVDEIFNEGYSEGFKDGRINALSYIIESLHKNFSATELSTAEWEIRNRTLREWQRQEEARKRKEAKEMDKLIQEVAEEASKSEF